MHYPIFLVFPRISFRAAFYGALFWILLFFLLIATSARAADEAEGKPAPKVAEPSSTAVPFAKNLPETPADLPAGAWTLVILPDTQYYSLFFPEVFRRQTEWIAANKDKRNIRFVLHEGDVTDQNTPAEWERARVAMNTLNQAKIPYALVCGNHDYIARGDKSDRPPTLINQYFKPADYSQSGRVGYFEPDRLENTWHTFTAPTGKYLVFALEFGPRDAVLDWADKVAASMPDHQAILLTHAYLYNDSTRYDGTAIREKKQPGTPKDGKYVRGSVNDGEEMWQKLVSKNPNFAFVFNGHVCGSGKGYLASKGAGGNTVHQMLVNFQDGRGAVKPRRGWGGGGFLRLLEFLPDGHTVRVRTYSPWYDEWLHDKDYEFSLDVPSPSAVSVR